MLHTSRNALGLQALDVRHHHAGGEIWVFAHIFKVTAVERCAENVHTGTENHVFVAVESLLSKALAIDAGKRWVERSGEASERGKSDTRVVGLSRLAPFVPQHIGANSMWSVIGPQVGESETRHAGCRKFTLCMYYGDFFIESHAVERIFDSLFYRFCLIEIHRGVCHGDKTSTH